MPQTNNVTIHFKPDGDKRLVKALKELARAQRALNKELKTAGTTLDQQRKRVEANSRTQAKHNSMMNKARSGIAQYRNTLLLGAFAVGLFSKTIGALTRLFAKQEAAEKKLSVALGMHNQRLLEFASAQQLATTFGDEVTISAMAQAAAFTKNTAAIEQMVIAAQDLAVGRGMDLTSAMDQISKSIFTSTNTLKRYIDVQTEGLDIGDKFNAITKAIQENYGGQAAGQVDTYAGATKQLANIMGDLGEEIGKMLAKSLLPAVKALNVFVEGMSSLLPILPFLTKAMIAFSLAVMTSATRMKAAWIWTLKLGKAFIGLKKNVTAAKLAIATMARTLLLLIAIEVIMNLFDGMSSKAKGAQHQVVELTGSISNLAEEMAKRRTISQYQALLDSVTKDVTKQATSFNIARTSALKLHGSLENLVTRDRFQMLQEYFGTFGAFKDQLHLVASGMEGVHTVFKRMAGDKKAKFLLKDLGMSLVDVALGSSSLSNALKENDKLYVDGKINLQELVNIYKDYEATLEKTDFWTRELDEAMKEKRGDIKKLREGLEKLVIMEQLLLDTGVSQVELEEEMRRMRLDNLKWVYSIIPNLEKQEELLRLQNEHTGAQLELELILQEARIREQSLTPEQLENTVKLINQKQQLTNVMKQETFIMNSFNKALLEGINNNGRFAESFVSMIKKMVAEMIAHMATFILFQAVIPGGAGMNPIQYAIGKMTGAAFGIASSVSGGDDWGGGGNDMSTHVAFGAMQGISLENQNATMQGGGGSVVVNFSGNVMSQDFIENDAIPAIKQAIRRGADIGVS